MMSALALGCSAPGTPLPRASSIAPAPVVLPEATFALQADFAADVTSLSPDGSVLVTTPARGRTIDFWSVAERALLARAVLPEQAVSAPRWAPTSGAVVMTMTSRLCLWDLTRDLRTECYAVDAARPPIWSLRGSALAILFQGHARVVDVVTTKTIAEREIAGDALLRDVGEKGARVVFAVGGKNQVWSTATGLLDDYADGPATLDAEAKRMSVVGVDGTDIFDLDARAKIGHVPGRAALLWSTQGARAAFLDDDKKLAVWDEASPSPIHPFATALEGPPVWVGRDGLLGFSAGGANAFDFRQKRVVPLGPGSLAESAAVGLDPEASTVVLRGGEIRVVDLATGRTRATFPDRTGQLQVGFPKTGPIAVVGEEPTPIVVDLGVTPPVTRGAFPRELWSAWPIFVRSNDLLGGACSHGFAQLDARTGVSSFRATVDADVDRGQTPLLSDDGQRLAVRVRDKMVVFDLAGRELLAAVGRHGALSHDGSLLAVWDGGTPDSARVLRVADGKELGAIDLGATIHLVEFAQGSSALAIQAFPLELGASIVVWDAAQKKSVASFEGVSVAPVFAPDGRALALAFPTRVDLIDTASWKTNRSFPSTLMPMKVAFSPDGKKLVVVGKTRNSRARARPGDGQVIDVDTGVVLATLRGVSEVAWTHDSSALVFDSYGRLTRLTLSATGHMRSEEGTPILLRSGLLTERVLAGGEVVLTRDAEGQRILVRVADGAQLWVRVTEDAGDCSVVVHDEEGHFDGEPAGRLRFRTGSDLRTAHLDASAAMLARYRRPGMLADFFAGKR